MKRLALVVPFALLVAPSFAGPQANGSLDLAKRIRAQATLEEVYWRHRIWPEANPGGKPPLQQVLPEKALRDKALDPLRKSAALESLWNRPVTTAALQSEIDRMVRDTHSPEMLRELFAALGDDPVLIAEVLARPLVADRLVRRFYSRDNRMHDEVRQRAEKSLAQANSVDGLVRAGGTLVRYKAIRETPEEEAAGKPDRETRTLDDAAWRALVNRLADDLGEAAGDEAGDPRALRRGRLSSLREDADRFYATMLIDADATSVQVAEVAWPKQSFDEWWGTAATRFDAALPEASGPYVIPTLPGTTCAVGTWTPLKGWTPPARSVHTAVWTGTEMLVWGGSGPTDGLGASVGGRYDPATDAWSVMGSTGAPLARQGHTAIWTGTRMIVWGGGYNSFSTGGLCDPITDSWTPTRNDATTPEGRSEHTAVWTGSRMIVWGGIVSSGNKTATGGRYDPATDTWQSTGNVVPTGGYRGHTAIWTGSRMIIWGGEGSGIYGATAQTGARYDPIADTWEATKLDATTPADRAGHFAAWTGTRMIVWGGFHRNVPGSPGVTTHTTGAQYDPVADSWLPTKNDGTQPPGVGIQYSVWTGAEWLLWGYASPAPFNPIGRRYDPSADLWHPMSTGGPAPSARGAASAVWTGQEMIVWGGGELGTNRLVNTGGRYDPVSDTWVATAADQPAPGPRFDASAVWTGSEMIVWGGGENNPVKTGHRYDPATDSWQPVRSDATAPEARSRHTAVWTGQEMIVWGGEKTTGGRYSPAGDSWLPTRNDISTPTARALNTAVWTGTEMIVWGGITGAGNVKTGGRYRPDTDAWLDTQNDATAPSARNSHSAVWTGQQMIVWGGAEVGIGSPVNTGARYDPISNTWTPTRTDVSTPPARQRQSAVWTGSRMIIWGGLNASFTALQSGGRYDPVTDAWVSTNLASPAARTDHSAHWTGSEMIVWGGGTSTDSGFLNSGGLYHPGFNSWTHMTIDAKTPAPRDSHVSVLSGNGMIVWGGNTISGDGAEYCLCSPATAHYRDVDGDGFGDASTVITTCLPQAGYVPVSGDCSDADAGAWATPGEALNLLFDDQTTMHWSAPASLGGLAVTYDVLVSDHPDGFVDSMYCLATETPALSSSDESIPPPGTFYFYRVRARNSCPGGLGPVGTDSEGTPVAAAACP